MDSDASIRRRRGRPRGSNCSKCGVPRTEVLESEFWPGAAQCNGGLVLWSVLCDCCLQDTGA